MTLAGKDVLLGCDSQRNASIAWYCYIPLVMITFVLHTHTAEIIREHVKSNLSAKFGGDRTIRSASGLYTNRGASIQLSFGQLINRILALLGQQKL